ncbi:glycoside hydrolase family 16 protein [Kineococcus gypseus]|uniref:glycoside hydrolase family 16 protein n=1 Tax=Kineococcus gypseus TaxID=1637102 RepID=UPI003D7C8897
MVALVATAVTAAVVGDAVVSRRSAVPAPAEPADWRQVFVEEFDDDVPVGQFPGPRYASSWSAYPSGWTDTTGRGAYRPERVVSVRDGVLDFRVHVDDGQPVSAALVPSLPTYGQTHGRYAVRFRADPVPGFKLTFLLWPDSERWPDDGEVNFPEGDLDGTFGAFMHHADPAGGQDQFETGRTFADWHTAVVEWRPGEVRFLLDGELVGTSTTSVPSRSMHWVLQTETSTTPGREPRPGAEGHVQVDWVAAWSYRGAGAA